MNSAVKQYLATIGSVGGRVSRRDLSRSQAKQMVLVREARRAFRIFHTQCFWSFRRDYQVTAADIDWVAEKLLQYGNAAAQKKAEYLLCR